MSWTALRTWATDDIVTSSAMNTDVRDNLGVLSIHQHSGDAGDGAGLTIGVVLTESFARHDTDAV